MSTEKYEDKNLLVVLKTLINNVKNTMDQSTPDKDNARMFNDMQQILDQSNNFINKLPLSQDYYSSQHHQGIKEHIEKIQSSDYYQQNKTNKIEEKAASTGKKNIDWSDVDRPSLSSMNKIQALSDLIKTLEYEKVTHGQYDGGQRDNLKNSTLIKEDIRFLKYIDQDINTNQINQAQYDATLKTIEQRITSLRKFTLSPKALVAIDNALSGIERELTSNKTNQAETKFDSTHESKANNSSFNFSQEQKNKIIASSTQAIIEGYNKNIPVQPTVKEKTELKEKFDQIILYKMGSLCNISESMITIDAINSFLTKNPEQKTKEIELGINFLNNSMVTNQYTSTTSPSQQTTKPQSIEEDMPSFAAELAAQTELENIKNQFKEQANMLGNKIDEFNNHATSNIQTQEFVDELKQLFDNVQEAGDNTNEIPLLQEFLDQIKEMDSQLDNLSIMRDNFNVNPTTTASVNSNISTSSPVNTELENIKHQIKEKLVQFDIEMGKYTEHAKEHNVDPKTIENKEQYYNEVKNKVNQIESEGDAQYILSKLQLIEEEIKEHYDNYTPSQVDSHTGSPLHATNPTVDLADSISLSLERADAVIDKIFDQIKQNTQGVNIEKVNDFHREHSKLKNEFNQAKQTGSIEALRAIEKKVENFLNELQEFEHSLVQTNAPRSFKQVVTDTASAMNVFKHFKREVPKTTETTILDGDNKNKLDINDTQHEKLEKELENKLPQGWRFEINKAKDDSYTIKYSDSKGHMKDHDITIANNKVSGKVGSNDSDDVLQYKAQALFSAYIAANNNPEKMEINPPGSKIAGMINELKKNYTPDVPTNTVSINQSGQ